MEEMIRGLSRRQLEALVHFFPIYGIPPGGQIIRTLVLVLQIAGMFPDIIAQDREMALHQWAVLIGSRHNLQLAAFTDQPAPARAELLGCRFVELLL